MRVIRRRDILGLAGLALLASACAGGGSAPQDSFYRLAIDDPGQRYDPPLLDGTVEVTRFSGDGVISERAIIYSEDGPRLRQYNYHYWVDAPTRLAQDAIVEALRLSGAAARVVTPEMRVRSDYRVTGTLSQLRHDLTGDRPQVVMAAEIGVVRARDGEIVMLRDYENRQTVASREVPDAVKQFSRAVTAITAAFLDDLAAASGR